MNENINLCEILKGHKGETFYSPIIGEIKFSCIDKHDSNSYILYFKHDNCTLTFTQEGKYYKEGELMIFPSKDQRDWNKWAEEQDPKVPKTWSDYETQYHIVPIIGQYDIEKDNDSIISEDKLNTVGKSAIALIKIHQLIEVGYGGNVTDEEWEYLYTDKYTIECLPSSSIDIFSIEHADMFNHIAFHTKEQAEEFMSYPENIQLLKDFYMI